VRREKEEREEAAQKAADERRAVAEAAAEAARQVGGSWPAHAERTWRMLRVAALKSW
jgi:hypothetical protein